MLENSRLLVELSVQLTASPGILVFSIAEKSCLKPQAYSPGISLLGLVVLDTGVGNGSYTSSSHR